MISTEEIKKRKEALENALKDVEIALNHDEYVKPFKFERNDLIKMEDLSSPSLKNIMRKCISNGSGFDPNLVTQHIEHEALDQFNEIVKEEIKGKDISHLMGMRHELELIMLKERKEHYAKEIDKINKMLIESVTGVEVEKVTKIDKRRKAHKE